MAWLPDGEKISKISLFVLAQLTNVTETDRHRVTAIAALCIASHGKNTDQLFNCIDKVQSNQHNRIYYTDLPTEPIYRVLQKKVAPKTFWNIFTSNFLAIHIHIHLQIFVDLS